MSAIRGKNTKPELIVRKSLHARGFRFRLHRKDLPGNPDIVLPKWRAAIFVHGCFWHGHECPLFVLPKTRPDFWKEKISGNVRRDLSAEKDLIGLGWRIAIVWECSLRGKRKLPEGQAFDLLEKWLTAGSQVIHIEGNDVSTFERAGKCNPQHRSPAVL